jgi:hypothetical protein
MHAHHLAARQGQGKVRGIRGRGRLLLGNENPAILHFQFFVLHFSLLDCLQMKNEK